MSVFFQAVQEELACNCLTSQVFFYLKLLKQRSVTCILLLFNLAPSHKAQYSLSPQRSLEHSNVVTALQRSLLLYVVDIRNLCVATRGRCVVLTPSDRSVERQAQPLQIYRPCQETQPQCLTECR